ncbi:MAG: Uncharacterized MFS-type transporter, partial [uncultured Rubrobacteraceae bacterium]
VDGGGQRGRGQEGLQGPQPPRALGRDVDGGPRRLQRDAGVSEDRAGARRLERAGGAPHHRLHAAGNRVDAGARRSLRPARAEEDPGPSTPALRDSRRRLRPRPKLRTSACLALLSGDGGRRARDAERHRDRGYLRRARALGGPRLQLERPLRRHRELPGHRRRARDVRVVLPIRAAARRNSDRHPGGLLAAQPGAAQRAGPLGVLRERVVAPARQGGGRPRRGLAADVRHPVRAAALVPPDPDERPLRRAGVRDRGRPLGRLPDDRPGLLPTGPPDGPLLGEDAAPVRLLALRCRPRPRRRDADVAPTLDPPGPLRRRPGHQPPERLLPAQRPRPEREPRGFYGDQRHGAAHRPDGRTAPHGLLRRHPRRNRRVPRDRRHSPRRLRASPRLGPL